MLHHLNRPIAADPLLPATSRRGFLKAFGGVGAGLIIGLALPRTGTAEAATGAADADVVFNPFVSIAPNGQVTVLIKHLDKGQGIATGLVTLVADELDASPDQMVAEFSPANTELYKNLFFGIQGTGGSTSMANSFMQYRTAAAAARTMLVAAAAAAWSVPAGEIKVAGGRITHGERSASFGDLAAAASALPVPAEPKLKTPEEWVYIGKDFRRVDVPVKSAGAPGVYGMDVHMDDMLVVTVIRAPKWGATVKSFDAAEALKVKGVVDVKSGPFGVAVFADKTWPAIKARDLVTVEWDEAAAETRGSEQIFAEYAELAKTAGAVANDGDAEGALAKAAEVIEAEYRFPYLAHAPMEPLNVTILADAGKSVTIWTGAQFQSVDQMVAGGILGIAPEKVAINTLWAGGSFGRRAVYNSEYIAEAALVAKTWGKAQPLKLVWTREDDIKGGYYRPAYLHRVRAGVDAEGNISGWEHRVVGQSIFTGTAMEQMVVKNGVDDTSVEGIHDTTYAIPGLRVELHSPKVGVPVLWWRSVGHTHTAYVMETMIDLLAAKAGKDPVAFRLALIKDDPRKAAVLKLAAEKAGWDTPPAEGRYRGVAVHKSFNTYVAEVAEITYADGEVKVEKVVCAVDCGVAVNPDNIKAQMEGGIGFGLGAVLRNAVTLTDGVVDQANFDTFEPLRMSDMPVVEVHVVPSAEAPTGVGEPGVPPIGPAVANAVFKATGKHPRLLPFTTGDFA
ncbi:xanthine dehydrogenase family protein molybdopterin-binding subunit [Methylobrevis pamukkalensis]|uniref:Isoquinoline 1-oxidoreductase subunit beta n=1 Tax=Methylobrevis pamukkalensis TaxID=1439726 RepID=A0A1E3H5A0_9HYPH|nr:xanthine dehydrogenase family protein molybdopterin-binding subunit [Methylobrevis pamukkalensis]ODN71325.1 Isoquinoline 1-oxidoreductase subunit beta [Methylobrevis pamukkalensis]